MMSNSLKNQERKITTVILGFLLIGFFVPTNIAFAAASIPGITPSAPGPGNDVCFAARSSTTFSMNYEYCYATLATCTTNQALVVSPAVLATGCLENYSTVGLLQKTFGKTSYAGTQSILSPLYHIGDILEKAVLAALVGIAALFYKFASLFLVGMGSLLDIAISSTINSDFYSGLTVINIGWTAVRDFSNMFFIFALLFIAIKTILGMAGSSTKRWVANLIIAAILINFSLFATKVVIDAGNILALGFWSKMQVTSGGITGPSATMTLFQGLKLQSITDPKDSSGKPITLPGETKLLIYLGGGIFMFIAGYVFLAGAIMMMIRSVTLIILMIVSPFAFLGFGLPVAGGFANKWLSKLIGSAFVAPAFIAMLYLVSTIVNSPDLFKLTNANGLSMGGAIAGDISSYAIVYNYLLMIILVLASLSVANAVSSKAGSTAGAWAKKGIAGGSAALAGGGALAYRRTYGKHAANKLNDKQLQANAKLEGAVGIKARADLAKYERAAKRTGDIRNAPILGAGMTKALGYGGVNIGTGTKTSAFTHREGVEKSEDEEIAKSKRLFPDNPEAQRLYLKERLGKTHGEDKNIETKLGLNESSQTAYGEGRHKKMSDALDIEASKKKTGKAAEDKAEEVTAKEKEARKKIEADRDEKLASVSTEEEKLAIHKEADEEIVRVVAGFAGEMSDSMKNLSSAQKANLAEKYSESAAFASNLNKADLNAIQRKAISENGYNKDPKTLEKLTKSISQGSNYNNIKYMRSPEGKLALFEMGDIEEHDMTNYERNKLRVTNAKKAEAEAYAMKPEMDAEAKLNAAYRGGDSQKVADVEREIAANKSRTADINKAEGEAYKSKFKLDPLYANLNTAKTATAQAQATLDSNRGTDGEQHSQQQFDASQQHEQGIKNQISKITNA